MTNFGKLVRELREYKDMTLTQVAEKSGVNEATINNWENGIYTPTVNNYEAVLNAMGFALEITLKEINK